MKNETQNNEATANGHNNMSVLLNASAWWYFVPENCSTVAHSLGWRDMIVVSTTNPYMYPTPPPPPNLWINNVIKSEMLYVCVRIRSVNNDVGRLVHVYLFAVSRLYSSISNVVRRLLVSFITIAIRYK